MKDLWNKFTEALRHNLGLSVTSAIALVIVFWLGSCQSVTRSPVTGLMVDREELVVEYDVEVAKLVVRLDELAAKAILSEADLDRQDAVKAQVAQIGTTLAQGGTINPVGVITSLMALMGVGAAVDNRIKDRIIQTQKHYIPVAT